MSKIRELSMPPKNLPPRNLPPRTGLVRGCPSTLLLPQQVQPGRERQTDRLVRQTSSSKEPAGLERGFVVRCLICSHSGDFCGSKCFSPTSNPSSRLRLVSVHPAGVSQSGCVSRLPPPLSAPPGGAGSGDRIATVLSVLRRALDFVASW